MTTEPLDLDALAALASAAIHGPWTWLPGESRLEAPGFEDRWGITVLSTASGEYYNEPGYVNSFADAEFIAVSRTAVPALIAEVRRLRALCDDDLRRHRVGREVVDALTEERDEARALIAEVDEHVSSPVRVARAAVAAIDAYDCEHAAAMSRGAKWKLRALAIAAEERDAERAKVEAVRALCDSADRYRISEDAYVTTSAIRALLGAP